MRAGNRASDGAKGSSMARTVRLGEAQRCAEQRALRSAPLSCECVRLAELVVRKCAADVVLHAFGWRACTRRTCSAWVLVRVGLGWEARGCIVQSAPRIELSLIHISEPTRPY